VRGGKIVGGHAGGGCRGRAVVYERVSAGDVGEGGYPKLACQTKAIENRYTFLRQAVSYVCRPSLMVFKSLSISLKV
jgi:hypothetical protein